jgi:hypothetical protein
LYFKFVNVIQDGDLHIWCFDLIVMIEIIVEMRKKNIYIFFLPQIFYYKLSFLIQQSYTPKCRHKWCCSYTHWKWNFILHPLNLIHCMLWYWFIMLLHKDGFNHSIFLFHCIENGTKEGCQKNLELEDTSLEPFKYVQTTIFKLATHE